jgi:hypothetical protein
VAAALLGLAGVLAAWISLPGYTSPDLGLQLSLKPPVRALLVATAASLAMLVALVPANVDRLRLLGLGLAGLTAASAFAFAPGLWFVALVLLLLGACQAALPGRRPFADRYRAPALAAILLGMGALLAAAPGDSPAPARLAALALVLGLVAAIGLIPNLQSLDPEEPSSASPLVWTAFLGPVLALALIARFEAVLPLAGASAYGSLLIGIGLLNLFWAVVGAWRVAEDAAAWRYSFLADWGLALVALGLLVPDGRAAAYLVLLSLLLVRLPLYFCARPVVLGRQAARLGPLNLLLAAALAGAAPFSGFMSRVLLLRGATEIYWPLAAVLVLAMLLWLPHSVRLARSLGRPRGRAALGVALALVLALAMGLYPGAFLAAFGL